MKSDMQGVEVENQILIAGAGPSGLALAAELSRRGVSTAIIDRQAAGANTSRACVVHARTMEILEPLGVTRDLLAEGVKVPIFRIRDRDRPLLTINFSEIPSSYQFYIDDSAKQDRANSTATPQGPRSQCNAAMRTDPLFDVAIAD
jgi:2-polyprenyl-6-methoxyphenol hydroxylase-like FAD-dependent oxidoreductase